MNRFGKSLDRIKKGVVPQDSWTEEDVEHYKTITEALEICEKLVQCMECKSWHKDTGWCDKHSHFIDPYGDACHPWESCMWKDFDENDFCSNGERREENAVD